MTNLADEIDMLTEQLTTAWGSVVIGCDGKTCVVANGVGYAAGTGLLFKYEAPTLIEALRLAVESEVDL